MLHSILFEYISMVMGRATADNRLGENEKLELCRLLVNARSNGFTLSRIAEMAGVKQPFVSLAARKKLEVRTDNTARLFEFLRANHYHSPGRMKADVPGAVLEALAPLLDGTLDGERRVLDLLRALKLFLEAGPAADRG